MSDSNECLFFIIIKTITQNLVLQGEDNSNTPLFVKRDVYDKLLDIMEKGIKKSKVSNQEKDEAQKRLIKTLR